jgi:hypothetical protein
MATRRTYVGAVTTGHDSYQFSGQQISALSAALAHDISHDTLGKLRWAVISALNWQTSEKLWPVAADVQRISNMLVSRARAMNEAVQDIQTGTDSVKTLVRSKLSERFRLYALQGLLQTLSSQAELLTSELCPVGSKGIDAKYLALQCVVSGLADLYETETGKSATAYIHSHTGEYKGTFLIFARDAVSALNLEIPRPGTKSAFSQLVIKTLTLKRSLVPVATLRYNTA